MGIELILSALVAMIVIHHFCVPPAGPEGLRSLVPAALVNLRIAIAPFLILDAFMGGGGTVWTVTYVAAIVSDIFDGVIARSLGIATEALRTADSYADQLLFIALGASAWNMHQQVVLDYSPALLVALAAQLTLFATSFAKFGMMPCCHGYSAKLWGLSLLIAVVALFGYGFAPLLWGPIVCCCLNAIDEIAITLILPEWQHDVKSVWHAMELRQELLVVHGSYKVHTDVLRS